MKRILVLFTVLVCLTAMITGCGAPASDISGSSAEAGESSVESTYGPMSQDLINMLNDGNFTMKIRMAVGVSGQEVSTDMTLAQRTPDYAMEMSAEGEVIRIVMVGESMMMVSDSQQMAIDLSLMQTDPSAYEMPEVAGAVTFLESGTGTVMDKELPYDEYAGEDGSTIRYYFDGDNFAYLAVEAEGGEAIMEILEFSDSVDESLFSIPDNYQRIESLEDLAALGY